MTHVLQVLSVLGVPWRPRSRAGHRPHRLPLGSRSAPEAGMTTAEYAIGTIAACTFAALLIAVVRSPEIRTALVSIITSALALGQ